MLFADSFIVFIVLVTDYYVIVKRPDKDIMLYTGFSVELIESAPKPPNILTR